MGTISKYSVLMMEIVGRLSLFYQSIGENSYMNKKKYDDLKKK